MRIKNFHFWSNHTSHKITYLTKTQWARYKKSTRNPVEFETTHQQGTLLIQKHNTLNLSTLHTSSKEGRTSSLAEYRWQSTTRKIKNSDRKTTNRSRHQSTEEPLPDVMLEQAPNCIVQLALLKEECSKNS
jgi:hypothetical protein